MVGARGGVIEHNLVRKDVKNALLHCGLGIGGCGGTVTWDDDENLNVIEGV